MEIVLRQELAELFQDCMDTIDSYTDPENPNAVTQVVVGFRKQILDNPDFVMEMPSYLALSLYKEVGFKDEQACVDIICAGSLPCCDDFQIRQGAEELKGLLAQIREMDEELLQKAVVVAFCLMHPDSVRSDDIAIVRTMAVPG